MPERIFLTYTNATAVPYQGAVLGYHVVLNYIDSKGAHRTLEGMPQNGFRHNIEKLVAAGREELVSDGVRNTDSPFQRMKARAGEGSGTSLNLPHTMVAEGDDLSSRWALMEGFADEVNSIGYEYRPVSQNSNSFAGGALQRAGFFGPGTEFPEKFDRQLVFDPVSGETRSLSVPGFEKPLANPINTATPMPFPLSELVAPVIPTHGFPAPNLPSSFGGRFGDSSAAPGGASNTRSPVLRTLEQYRRSAAQDGPAPTSVQGVPTPAFQPDAVHSPAGDFFEKFLRGSADATTRSPVSFKTSGSNAGGQAADNFSGAGNGPLGGLGGFIGSSPMDPAEAMSPMHGLAAADFSSEATNHIEPSDNAPGGPRPAAYPQLRRVSSAFPDITPRDPEQPVTPPEPAPLLGIFSGEPILPLPRAVWGLLDRSSASPRGALSDFLAGLSRRNPAELSPDDDPRGFDRDERGRPWFLQGQR
jgi:hypothetical protein